METDIFICEKDADRKRTLLFEAQKEEWGFTETRSLELGTFACKGQTFSKKCLMEKKELWAVKGVGSHGVWWVLREKRNKKLLKRKPTKKSRRRKVKSLNIKCVEFKKIKINLYFIFYFYEKKIYKN